MSIPENHASAPVLHLLTGSYGPWPMPPANRVELDLGCGRGGFLLALAERYPERLVLGADVMIGRLRRVARKIERRRLANAVLLRVNAWPLMTGALPDASLDRVHILCPDPWPKDRHAPRRLCSSEFLGRVAGKLKPGGILHLASDHQPYVAFMAEAIAPLAGYERDDAAVADVADLQTDFERDFAAAGVGVTHLAFRRRA